VKDVVNWLAALQTKKTNYDSKKHGKRETKLLSRQTRKHALNLLRRFFVWAVEQEHATSNPCVGLQVVRRDGDEGEGYQEGWYLDATDQARVLQILKDDPERWIVAFAIGTGLRQGEQWCLHVEDVHVDGDDPMSSSASAPGTRRRSAIARRRDERAKRGHGACRSSASG
jgi:site-specific recombinase XerC